MQTESLISAPTGNLQLADVVNRRHQRFVFFLTLCGALIVVAVIRMVYLSTTEMTDGIAAGTEECKWQYNVIPALRGRILDSTGIPLAWSERTFSLAYEKPENPAEMTKDLYRLQQLVDVQLESLILKCRRSQQPRITLKQDLTAKEIEALDKDLDSTFGTFRVHQQFIRHTIAASPAVRTMIGETWQNGRKQVGTTGFERKYNNELTGIDGYYRVLVDKNGTWIPGTWEQLRQPREGFDKYSNFHLNALQR